MHRGNRRPGQHQQHRSRHQNHCESNDLAVSLVIALPVTSRSIGFCTAEAYSRIHSLEHPRYKQSCIYRSYRAFLALFQAKVFAASRRSWLQGVVCDEELIHQERSLLEAVSGYYGGLEVPSAIAALIAGVGVIEADSRVFVPFIAPNNYTPEGAFIPQSEHVYLYNLRETVSALADENTALEYRLEFHKHNPIPGTIWRDAPENPILTNPDEIIPISYSVSTDLVRDCSEVISEMRWDAANLRDPESDGKNYYSPIKFESVNLSALTLLRNEKSILMCDDQNSMKVPDRQMGEDIGEYCRRSWVMGFCNKPTTQNLVVFTNNEISAIREVMQTHKFKYLLGERPFLPLRDPHYWIRETRMCCQTSSYHLEPKTIPMCITTRAIGFGVVKVFQNLFDIQNVLGRCSIYEVYRASLYLMQLKVREAQIKCRGILEHYEALTGSHYASSEDIYYRIPVLEPIARPINAVGFLQINDLKFAPVIAKNRKTNTGVFIPQSEHVYFTNLWETVEALANENTPVEYRVGFYKNNPIPGTVWRGAPENPVLTNAADVIPADYDAEQDLQKDFSATRTVMYREENFRQQLKSINIDADGSKAMLTCNDQNNMRVVDRHEDENLLDYYKRLKIEGNINEFHNLMPLNRNQQLDGIMCLLGERPLVKDLRYPNYVTREKEVCVQRCNVPYAQCSDYLYHIMI